MPTIDIYRSPRPRALSVAIVAMYLLLLPALLPTARAWAPSTASFEELMAQAEEQRTAEAYAQSAKLYGDAYRARAEGVRADATGEIALRSAMSDYDIALEDTPNDRALLEAQFDLLNEFLSARQQGRAGAIAAKAKAVPVVPPDLVGELDRLETRIADLEEAERRAEAEAERQKDQSHEPISETQPAPRVEPKPESFLKRDSLILGLGLGSFVGGTTLIASGVWNFVQTKARADAKLEALDSDPLFTDDERQTYRTGLDDWTQQWRNVATALVVSGAGLTAAGIGLTTWGVVRMRKHRSASRAQAALTPIFSRDQVGLNLTLGF